MQQSDSDRAARLAERNHAMLCQGRCDRCPPHRGENSPRDHRWDNHGRPMKAKPKTNK